MQALASFFDDLHRHLTRDPHRRLMVGLLDGLGGLPEPGLDAERARVAEARGLLHRLDGLAAEVLSAGGLSADQRLDLDLARLLLEQQVFLATVPFNGGTVAEQKPDAGAIVGDGVFLLFVADPRPLDARLDDITARLEATPAYLEGALSRLTRPVARWAAVELDCVSGLPDLFATVEAAAGTYPGLERLRAARISAEAALADYARRLAALPTVSTFSIGREATERLLKLKGLDRDALGLKELATRFLVEIDATLESLRATLVARYGLPADSTVPDVHTFLNKHFAVQIRPGQLDDVLTHYEEERRRLLGFIRERNLFPVPDDQDMRLMRTPTFMAPTIPAGAMMGPPPFRVGVATSQVYLTLSDELLDEHTQLGIPLMMLHEGIPGHHLQLTYAARNPSIVRRHFDALDLNEGWTTMLEDYLLDLGLLGDLTDEARFLAKRDIARLGARVAIDLYFMSGDKSFLEVGVDADLSSDAPFEAAGNLLQAVTGFTPGRMQSELNWYSMERGYPLSYLAGNEAVWALKREVAEAAVGRLEGIELDRAFHRSFLEAGNMPVSFLRRAFQDQGLLPAGRA